MAAAIAASAPAQPKWEMAQVEIYSDDRRLGAPSPLAMGLGASALARYQPHLPTPPREKRGLDMYRVKAH